MNRIAVYDGYRGGFGAIDTTEAMKVVNGIAGIINGGWVGIGGKARALAPESETAARVWEAHQAFIPTLNAVTKTLSLVLQGDVRSFYEIAQSTLFSLRQMASDLGDASLLTFFDRTNPLMTRLADMVQEGVNASSESYYTVSQRAQAEDLAARMAAETSQRAAEEAARQARAQTIIGTRTPAQIQAAAPAVVRAAENAAVASATPATPKKLGTTLFKAALPVGAFFLFGPIGALVGGYLAFRKGAQQ
jgi:hypothetical protein